MTRLKKIIPFCIPPLLVMAVCGFSFYRNKLFPFGTGTVSWCDMSQQVIPLLCDFKDILSGKSSLFLNFQNAGGMNFWGVFFFFIASPFSLLTAFTDKADMIYLVNILTVLKLMTASVTSMIYFRVCQKKLPWYFAGILSVSYAFCGYGMLFYQNNIWLDMMYIFPLLLISFRYMLDKQRIMPYTAVMTAFVVVNYYISYMIVLFVLLMMSLVCWRYRKEEKYEKAPVQFIAGSFMAALLSAVVWLPSLIQYLSSGRTRSIIENLQECSFITNFETTVPMLLATASVFAIVIICTLDGKPRSKRLNTYLMLLFAVLVPIIIEPVNVMWHTGSYMSFPARYGFIAVFLAEACAGMYLSDEKHIRFESKKRCDNLIVFVICSALVYFFSVMSSGLVNSNLDTISNYVSTLWGNTSSFKLILEISAAAAASSGAIFLFYKKGWLSEKVMAVFLCAIVVAEGFYNLDIYVTSANNKNPQRSNIYRKVMEMSDKIDDDSFYRVGTSSKLFDVNLVGAMGYNSISHYTSVTSRDYMFSMKEMGYSSYWMEVGSHGGTEITDALLSMKYRIKGKAQKDESVYKGKNYSIVKNEFYLPLGIALNGDFQKLENLSMYERSDVQELLYENVLGGDKNNPIITKYYYTSENAQSFGNNTYKFNPSENSGSLVYQIKVEGRKSLYFDCFDKLSTDLTEPINGSFDVIVNGMTVQGDYPSSNSNGLLKLGEFEDESVTVTVKINKAVKCRSFGVFGIDLDMLSDAVNNTKSLNLTTDGGTIGGEYTANNAEKCVLFVPYQDSFTVKINGKKTDYSKCFGDFITFDLEKGINKIDISFKPKGFTAGASITVIGAAVTAIYLVFRKRIKLSHNVCRICSIMLMSIGVALIIVIYILPIIVNVFGIP